ncbi:hypothetical protein [Streptomyces sp. NPDC057677]|uniref:hypothetical protein n=1 Tax=unclassified Streptomyces TaxID=2593676 RepID=UPI0036A73477
MSDVPQTDDTMIAALLRERDGLVQRGLTDRVKQVDEQLKLRGYKKPTAAKKEQPPATPPATAPQGPADPATAPPKGRGQQPPATT